MAGIELVGLDADDTLWHNEQFFRLTEARFTELLAAHAEADHLRERLLDAERRNIKLYGFGIKGFTLSMIETAIDVAGPDVPGHVIAQILDAGRELLQHPVETLPGVRETVEQLADDYRLVLITKGDLFDQERKLAQSGLGEMFSGVEIVSDKNPSIYGRIFADYGADPAHAVMAGNSMKSDVLPAIAAGAHGIYVPHEHKWALEHAEAPDAEPRFFAVEQFADIKPLVDGL